MKPKPENTVFRAAWLLREGYVRGYEGDGVVAVWSQTYGEERTYYTTVDGCTCWIGENYKSVICKHRLAAHGQAVVDFASEMFAADSEMELIRIGREHAEALGALDGRFTQFARRFYAAHCDMLRAEEERAA